MRQKMRTEKIQGGQGTRNEEEGEEEKRWSERRNGKEGGAIGRNVTDRWRREKREGMEDERKRKVSKRI